MSTGTARAAAAAEKKAREKRIELCTELLGINIKHKAVFARVDELKSELKKFATDAGENFKETIKGKGFVYVAGEKEGTFKGDLPVVQPEVWKTLPGPQQDALIKKGVITIEPQKSGKYYGAVKVTLF